MAEVFEGWAILELMGHRRLAGHVQEATIAGGTFVRIDIPAAGDEGEATQFYAPGAVYCITPCAESLAREFAEGARPRPVHEWDLPRRELLMAAGADGDDPDDLRAGDSDRF